MSEQYNSITECLCGTPEATDWGVIDGASIVSCNLCGIRRVSSPIPLSILSQVSITCNGAFGEPRLHLPDIKTAGLQRRTVSNASIYLSQMLEPSDALLALKGLLVRNGILTVIAPDTSKSAMSLESFIKNGINPKVNFWYFNLEQLKWAVKKAGFIVLNSSVVDVEIELECVPVVEYEEVNIYGPPGIGDILWTFNKLPAIISRESPCKINYVICGSNDPKTTKKSIERSKDILAMCGTVDSFEFTTLPTPPDNGNIDPRKAAYNLFPNTFLEPDLPGIHGGKRIEDWRPEIPSMFLPFLHIPQEASTQAEDLLAKSKHKTYAVLYPGSLSWNTICTAQQSWFPSDWARLCIYLDKIHVQPVLVGADWDKDYAGLVMASIDEQDEFNICLNLVGSTSLPVAISLMENAGMTIGICAGLPMIAAHQGWNTIMLWPMEGVLPQPSMVCFHKEFQTNWIPPEVLKQGTYTPLTFGQFNLKTILDLLY